MYDIRSLVQNLESAFDGSAIHVFVPDIYVLGSDMVTDFLNTAHNHEVAMFMVYEKFVRALKEFERWMREREIIYNMMRFREEILTEEDFHCVYNEDEIHAEIFRSHSWMRFMVDTENVKCIQAKREDMVSASEPLGIKPMFWKTWSRTVVTIPPLLGLQYWLKQLYFEFFSQVKDGDLWISKCITPGCGKYFIPYSRTYNSQTKKQKYHSSSCRNLYHTRKRRGKI